MMHLSTISMLLGWFPGAIQWQSLDSMHINSTQWCCTDHASNANPCLRSRADMWHEHAWNTFPLVTSRQRLPQTTRTCWHQEKRLKVEMSDIRQRKHWGNDDSSSQRFKRKADHCLAITVIAMDLIFIICAIFSCFGKKVAYYLVLNIYFFDCWEKGLLKAKNVW